MGAVTCACFLVIAMAPTVKAREGERQVPETGTPTVFGPRSIQAEYRGRAVLMVQVPSGVKGAKAPPGLRTPLEPGEVRLSPALAERAGRDPLLARWFPYQRGPVLPVDAVASAGEYKAYIGVEPASLQSGIGFSDTFSAAYDDDFAYYQSLGFGLFVGVPALGLLVVSGRFGRRIRRERYAALRLLGMRGPECRAVLGIETGLPIAIGAALAAVVAIGWRPGHVVLPVVERWVFGEDARLHLVLVLITTAAVCALGVALGAATTRERAATGRLRTLIASSDVARPWTVAVYAGGVMLIVWALLRAQPNDSRRWLAVILVGVGLPGAVAYLAQYVARAIQWRDGPLPWFLAMRKLSSDPRSTTRLAGIVGIAVLAIGVSQPVAQVVAQPSSTWVGQAHDAGASTVLGGSQSLISPPLVLRGPPPAGTKSVATAVGLWPQGQGPPLRPAASALVASCKELEALLTERLPRCSGTIQRLAPLGDDGQLTSSAAPIPGQALEMHAANGDLVVPVSTPDSTLTVRNVDVPNSWSLLIPPSDPLLSDRHDLYITGVYLRTVAAADAWEAARAWVQGGSPAYTLENEFDALAVSDSTGAWLVLGFLLAAAIAFLAAALITFDDQRAAQEWATLRALGFSTRGLVGIRMLIALTAGLVAVAAATLPSMLLTFAYLRVNDEELTSFTPFVVSGAIGLVATLAVTLISASAQARRVGRAELRTN